VAELLPATLSPVSDSPPKAASGPGPTDAAETSKDSPVAEAAVTPKIESSAALDDAAKAMDAAVVASDPTTTNAVPAPVQAAVVAALAPAVVPSPDAVPSTPPTATSAAPQPPINIVSLQATTSGMHQQYVAPGVKSQSFWSSNGRQLMLLSATMMLGLVFLTRGSIGSGIGDLPGATSSGTTTLGGAQLTGDPQPQNFRPGMAGLDPNRTPQADFTVNAGAVGDTTARVPKTGDAGKNKGGYAQEQADLDVARALIDKDPNKALALVDQHDADYPRGILDPEARVIRVEAFAKKGDDAKALALGDEFLEDYPHSPGAGRVQAILETIKNKQGTPTPPKP